MTRAERERLFDELFAGNRARIQRLCYGYLGPGGDVDDLFQEVMINVWNGLPSFRGESRASTWLYRVAVNTALVHRRKRRATEPLPEILRDPSQGAHASLEDAERLAALRRAIASLPDQDRLIVTLLLEGLSYKEIAEITGLTVNHVGVKISRIKQALENILTEAHHGPL
jgi:RNA polymerase sigma-70 factor (ECF subfamily)